DPHLLHEPPAIPALPGAPVRHPQQRRRRAGGQGDCIDELRPPPVHPGIGGGPGPPGGDQRPASQLFLRRLLAQRLSRGRGGERPQRPRALPPVGGEHWLPASTSDGLITAASSPGSTGSTTGWRCCISISTPRTRISPAFRGS